MKNQDASDDTDLSKIWHLNKDSKPPSTTFYELKGNGFFLAAIVRKYTGARMTVKGIKQMVVLETSKLYDALGLFRSLQYDVAQFNAGFLKSSQSTTEQPSESETKYATFRLSRQAAAFGVRLSSAVVEGVGVIVRGLNELVQHLEEEFAERIQMAQANISAGLVDFDSLQEYLSPGRTVVDYGVVTGMSGIPTAMRVRASYYSRGKSLLGVVSTFMVAMEFVVAVGDGGQFAVVEAAIPQGDFSGTRTISGGGSFDMFSRPTESMLSNLKDRGLRYQVICGGDGDSMSSSPTGSGTLVEYTVGTFLPTTPPRGLGSSSTSNNRGSYSRASKSGGRLVVDTVLAWSRGVHCAKMDGMGCDAVIQALKTHAQKQSQRNSLALQQQHRPANASATGGATYTTGSSVSIDGDDSNDLLVLQGRLPESLVGLTWPVVPGFSLQARSWGSALVHGLSNVQFHEGAFDALVLPPSRKRLIKALVTNHEHASESNRNADVIAGKGEGSIFLLHGPPGVGKTLTAEAIAEMLHKPLYVVSMGELGTSPEVLEDRLQDILDLCVPWKALVLIDEAEMLLERRSKNDIIRNAMVCVMLRLLEYYSGILFLTTNRVESLDPAFQSRVTCALRYDDLSVESREEIWKATLERVGVAGVGTAASDIDIAVLAEYKINGRQIKNAVQLAMALCRQDKVDLAQEHLLQTLEITSAFLADTMVASAQE